MALVDFLPTASAPAHAGMWRICRAALARAIHNATAAWIVQRAIKELHALDDRTLMDIGLTRSEIEARVRRATRRRPYFPYY
jgi:uncharacterized protein YjiS (DUF1127 family)